MYFVSSWHFLFFGYFFPMPVVLSFVAKQRKKSDKDPYFNSICFLCSCIVCILKIYGFKVKIESKSNS